MRFTIVALVVIFAGGAAATSSWAPVRDADNSATMQDVPRSSTAPCGPVHLRLVVASPSDADLVSGLLWQVGMPAGSTIDFAWPDGIGTRAPAVPDIAWARSLVC